MLISILSRSEWRRQATAPRPLLIVVIVFMGAFLTTLQGRLFAMSLGDLRGHFSLDIIEGMWLSTALNAAQLITMPITVWLSLIFGAARVLIVPSVIITVVTLIIPFAKHYETLLILHVMLGLCLGIYLPLTISLALRNLKPHFWLMAMAVYSLRASFGTDLGVGMSGIYTDILDWRWTYWLTAIVGPIIAYTTWISMPFSPIDYEKMRQSDWGGMALLCSGLTITFMGFTLGETLGWLDSGLVISCLCAGLALLFLTLIHVVFNRNAFADLSSLYNHNVRTALLIACFYGLLMAPTALLMPNFLSSVGQLKPLQIGDSSSIVFIIYLFFTPLAVWLVQRLDARLVLIAGLTIITLTAGYCGSNLSYEWRSDQYSLPLVFFAVGECLTLMGLIPIIVVNMNPAHGVAIGFYAPLARIFAPGIAVGFVAFILRISLDTHSALLTSSIDAAAPHLTERLAYDGLSGITAAIKREASVLSFADGYYLVFWAGIIALFLSATLKPAPVNPLTPPKAA